jgi:soluble lytic murein transglycosylase-like protein
MRKRVEILTALGVLALLPAAAHADVLEVDSGGARWIAGGNPPPSAAAGQPAPAAPAVPMAAMADPAVNAETIPAAYAAKVQELAARYDLSPALIEAVVWQESRWQAGARSPVGARGLAQLMPGTAQHMGVNADDPMANLEGGARYLREQLDRFNGDLEKALAAYNAGPGRVSQAGGVPNIAETKQSVTAVIGRLADHTRR